MGVSPPPSDGEWRRRFGRFRARYLIVALIVLTTLLPGFDWLVERAAPDLPFQLEQLWGQAWFNGLYLIVLGLVLAHYRIPPRVLFGRAATPAALRTGFVPTIFVFFFSVVGVYVMFYPLSLVWPDVMADMLLSQPDFLIYLDDHYPLLPNLFGLLAMCLVAPVLEEFFFRGVLLHRWTAAWTRPRAVLASSLLFGVMHVDLIGAVAFGLVMAFLYLRTQSLWVPIFWHAVHNVVVWLIDAGFAYRDGPLNVYTIDEFQADWPYAAGSAIVCLLIVWYVLRRPFEREPLRLPLNVAR